MSLYTSLTRFSLIVFLLTFTGSSLAQLSPYISEVRTGAAVEGDVLRFEVELIKADNVRGVFLFYKPFGEIQFTEAEMDLRGNLAEFTLSGDDVRVPYLEYYIGINLSDGSSAYYPVQVNVSEPPLQIAVSARSAKDAEVIILAPEKNTSVPRSEFFVSISLLRASDNVDRAKTKIYIGTKDVTSLALFADDLIMLTGDNPDLDMDEGTTTIRVEIYDKSGNLYHTVSSDYQLISEQLAEERRDSYEFRGDVTAESRSEDVQGRSTWYNNLRVNYESKYKMFELNANAYLTSEEESNKQPYNRYLVELRGGDWVKMSYGDATPRFPSLVLTGKRVRGFNGSLNFGFFNIQAAFGEINRGIQGKIDTLFTAANSPFGRSDIVQLDSAKYPTEFNAGYRNASVTFGSNERTVLAVRPSFGSGENFQWGLTYLHSKDQFEDIAFGGIPQENVVAGTDMTIAFDDQKFLFNAQAAISVQNTDITNGELTDSEIDTLFGAGKTFTQDPKTIKDLKKYIGSIITFNQYIEPLNYEEIPTLAAEATLSLNYFNNYFRGQYIYRGNDFQSFGNTFIRTDVAGININDRLRLMDNTLFIAAGFESLSDNLQGTKFATTTFNTINTSVSYFPRFDFPSILVSYTQNENTNDAKDSTIIINDITNRVGTQISYDFHWKYRTQMSLGYNFSVRDDKSISNFDVDNSSLNLSSNTNWSPAIVSNVNISYNSTKIQASELSYVTLTLGGRYYMLDNKLLINGSINPSFGDFERTALDLFGTYYFTSYLYAQAQIRYIVNSSQNSISVPNDFISGIMLRYNLY